MVRDTGIESHFVFATIEAVISEHREKQILTAFLEFGSVRKQAEDSVLKLAQR